MVSSLDYLNSIKEILLMNLDYYLGDKTQLINDFDNNGNHHRKKIVIHDRLSHTLKVKDIALAIAEEVYEQAKSTGHIDFSREEFLLLVEIVALAHDIGHTPFGHRGEEALDDVLSEVPGNNQYLKRRLENFGAEYEQEQNLQGTMRFCHNEHSVEEFIDLCDEYSVDKEVPIFFEAILQGILCHSTSKAKKTPDSLVSQIIRISDKIAGTNHDIEDLKVSGLLPADAFPANIRGVLNNTYFHRIRKCIEEVEREYRERGVIEGRREEHDVIRKKEGEIETPNFHDREAYAIFIAKSRELLTLQEERDKNFEFLYQMWEVRELIEQIATLPEDILENENAINKSAIKNVFHYFLSNPVDVLRQYPDFADYQLPERVAFYISQMSNKKFRAVYNEIAPELSKRIDKQYKLNYFGENSFELLANPIISMFLEHMKLYGFEHESTIRMQKIDRYYDDREQSLRNSGMYFRIRQRKTIDTEEAPEYTATLKETLEPDNPEDAFSVRQDHTVEIDTDGFDEALRKIKLMNINLHGYRIEREPIVTSIQSINDIILTKEGIAIRFSLADTTFLESATQRRIGETKQFEVRLKNGYFDPNDILKEFYEIVQAYFEENVEVTKKPLVENGFEMLDERRKEGTAEEREEADTERE